MGNSQSTASADVVYRTIQPTDVERLRALLVELQRTGRLQANQQTRYLEYQDTLGWTPLVLASAKGNQAAVDLLLSYGASLQHVSRPPECTTALHEAVTRGHTGVADILVQRGANPFMENGKGLTAVDLAINHKSSALLLLRLLERQAQFAGYLSMKVPKWGGLGSEWQSRWCVIMNRYPRANAAPSDRVVRTLLVCFKSQATTVPCCKVWLDGAVARPMLVNRGSDQLQCTLHLHKSHVAPQGAHTTGDGSGGYCLHLRPPEATSAGLAALQRFMDVCNRRSPGALAAARTQPRPPPPVTPRPPPTPAATPQPPPRQPASPPTSALPPGWAFMAPGPLQQGSTPMAADPPPPMPPRSLTPIATRPGESDEDLAKRLQHEYDGELAAYMRDHPGAVLPTRSRPCAPASPHAPATPSSSSSTPSAAQQQPLEQQGVSAPPMLQTQSGRLQFPDPDAAPTLPSSSASAPPVRNGTSFSAGPTASGVSASSGSGGGQPSVPSWAEAPSAAPARGAADEHDMCVICLSAPAEAGFLHGSSVHKCCCPSCAQALQSAAYPTCPVCREPIEHVILKIY